MDSGTVISLIFIFFTLQFPKGGRIEVNWWGNDVFMNSALRLVQRASCLLTFFGLLAADWTRQAFRTAPPGGIPVKF